MSASPVLGAEDSTGCTCQLAGEILKGQHDVGYCCLSSRRYGEALPWYQKAVAGQEQGDVHSGVDHVSLGASLHLLGVCLLSTEH
jgi:hypothetical protein